MVIIRPHIVGRSKSTYMYLGFFFFFVKRQNIDQKRGESFNCQKEFIRDVVRNKTSYYYDTKQIS